MDKQQATTLISSTFENAFDEGQYLRFLRELFNGQIDDSDDRKFDLYGQYIPDSFKDSVRRYKRLGTYTDPDGHEIDLLVVILRRDNALDRARTMQRNFAAYHLKRREKETAIIAYITEERSDWRFSMVRRESVVAFSEKGNLIAKDELTPVRRYSFLVGQNERSHTAQQQLFPILVDDKHDPTLDRLEEAFNIETVTKEFFERYKNLFLQLKEELDRLITQNPRVQSEFDQKGLETANFAKKLLGQIVFLYFLQKKGWLGVRQGDNWGAGPKNFLRELFDHKGVAYDNFFNDVLEPLFYEALAIERPDNVYQHLNVKIPFLNGGLFEPVGNYDWRNIDMLIDNGVFKLVFDTFDLYNFTVREDEPLEKEVAVDPEMLGKVFENLLEVTDRKSKGAFYTPREIVHYMCQESLINYLDTRVNTATRSFLEPDDPAPTLFEMPPVEGSQPTLSETVHKHTISREDIATFIRFGELAVQNDIAKEGGTVTYKYQMPQSIRTHARKLDEALASIKICDPAIGSGAFPVGMMQEIIKAREVLTTYLESSDDRTTYHFKRHAIQESIYGVDIDPGAIDIAKLRLWLSLVVDEDDYHHIKPLPNLDYKIVCGNSLLQAYHDLFNDNQYKELEKLKREFFSTVDTQRKSILKEKISKQIYAILASDIKFDIKVYFSEVFHSDNDNDQGFHIVIGNPPYLNVELISAKDKQYYGKIYSTFYKRSDIFGLFFELGLQRLTNSNGNLTFIVPSQVLNNVSYSKLRNLILENQWLREVTYVGDKVFAEASNDVCILFLDKNKPEKTRIVNALDFGKWTISEVNNDYFRKFDNLISIDDPTSASIYDKIFSRSNDWIENHFSVFQGIVTGNNSAYIFEGSQLSETDIERGLLHTILLGRDFEKWMMRNIDRKILYIDAHARISDYPKTQKWLTKFREDLQERREAKSGVIPWYSLQWPRNKVQLDIVPKILIQRTRNPRLKTRIVATVDRIGVYGMESIIFLTPKTKTYSVYYMVAILNSSTINFLYQTKYLNVAVKNAYLKKTPFPKVTRQQQDILVQKVEAIFGLTESEDYPVSKDKKKQVKIYEDEINEIVFDLYGFTEDEKEIIRRAN